MSVKSTLKNSPTQEVADTVNKLGLKAAAEHYQIDPSNLWRWLKKQKYVAKRQYVKEEQSTQRFQHA